MSSFDDFIIEVQKERKNRLMLKDVDVIKNACKSYNEKWFSTSKVFTPEVGICTGQTYEVQSLSELTFVQKVEEYRVDATTLKILLDDRLDIPRYFFYHQGYKVVGLKGISYEDLIRYPELSRDSVLKSSTIESILIYLCGNFVRDDIIWGPMTIHDLRFNLQTTLIQSAGLQIESRIKIYIDPPLGTSITQPKRVVLLFPSIRGRIYQPSTPYLIRDDTITLIDPERYRDMLMLGQIPADVNNDIGLFIVLLSMGAWHDELYRKVLFGCIPENYRDAVESRIKDTRLKEYIDYAWILNDVPIYRSVREHMIEMLM